MAGNVGLKQMQLVVDPWVEAGRALAESSQLHPTYADVHHQRGLHHLVLGEGAAAVSAFEEAVRINPEYWRARFGLMVALRLRDGSLDPDLWGREDLPSHCEEPERTLWSAWYLAQGGDRDGTRQVLQGLSGQPAWTALSWYALFTYEKGWGESTRARDAAAACAAANPLYRSILQCRGLISLGRRRGESGRAWVPREIGEPADTGCWNPALGEIYEYVGTMCARLGRSDAALSHYEEAFLRQGVESLHQVRLAHLALARGDEEEAVRMLCLAIELDPTSVAARIALGFEYQSQGYQAEALVQFEVAARLRSSYPDVQYNLGLLYDAEGRSDEAIRCLRKALEVNPGYFQARTTLARILFQREQHGDALEELSSLFAHGIRSADLHVQKAQAHLALNQVQEAVRELEGAIAVNPSYARTYYILGQAYRQLGLRRKARSAWQKYLERSRSWRDRQPTHDGGGWTQ